MRKTFDKLPGNLICEIAIYQEIEDLNNFLKINKFNKLVLSDLVKKELKFSPFIAWKKIKSFPYFNNYKSTELEDLPALLLQEEHEWIVFVQSSTASVYQKAISLALLNRYFGFMDFLVQIILNSIFFLSYIGVPFLLFQGIVLTSNGESAEMFFKRASLESFLENFLWQLLFPKESQVFG